MENVRNQAGMTEGAGRNVRPKTDMTPGKKEEKIELSFLGFKLKCSNPSLRTIIIIALILAFFASLIFFLPHGIGRWI